MQKKLRIFNITAIVLVIIMTAAMLITGAYAIWQMTPDAALRYELAVKNTNPSLKYQIFVPIDSEGKRIQGELVIKEYAFNVNSELPFTYMLDDEADAGKVAGLALVGWNGGIAINSIIIEEKVSGLIYGISGYTMPEDGLAVMQVKVDSEFRDYFFKGNKTLKEITIPKSVVRIDRGMFSSMPYLKTVTILGTKSDSELYIGYGAFEYCPELPALDTPQGRILEQEKNT